MRNIKNTVGSVTKTSGDYDEKYMKIKFNLADNLPLYQILKLYEIIIVVKFVFQEDESTIHKFY